MQWALKIGGCGILDNTTITYVTISIVQLTKKSIDYIPFHRAIVLKGKGAEDDELKEELEELQQTVKENFSMIDQRFDGFKVSASRVCFNHEITILLPL